MKTIQTLLKELNACNPAREWAKNKSVEEIIQQCDRGDWLLWLALEMRLPFKLLILARARCAKTVAHIMKDQRSIDAVNVFERFGMTDEVSLDELRKAADAAKAAYVAVIPFPHADFAFLIAATRTAYAVYATDYMVAESAAAAAAWASTDTYTSAYIENQKQTADICREVFGKELIEAVNAILNK